MLPNLGDVQQVLNTRFKRKSDGRFIMAQMYAPRHSATGGVEDPFRIVRVSPKSPMKAGDVLVSGMKKYLVVRGGVEELSGGSGNAVFKAIELDRSAVVSRSTKQLDSITKRTNDVLAPVGTMDYAATPMRQQEDVTRIQYDHYEILTDFNLEIGDTIDGNKVVQQKETRLGVTWGRMRDI